MRHDLSGQPLLFYNPECHHHLICRIDRAVVEGQIQPFHTLVEVMLLWEWRKWRVGSIRKGRSDSYISSCQQQTWNLANRLRKKFKNHDLKSWKNFADVADSLSLSPLCDVDSYARTFVSLHRQRGRGITSSNRDSNRDWHQTMMRSKNDCEHNKQTSSSSLVKKETSDWTFSILLHWSDHS